jgi:hypothetical protein
MHAMDSVEKFMTAEYGILMQGIAWLIVWTISPAFQLFEADPRWAHNFAMALIFIAVGLAYHGHKLSCQLVAVIASFLTIPTFLAFWSGIEATFAAGILLIMTIGLYLIERRRSVGLLNSRPRLKAWLTIHFLNFAYIGLAHMPLIFFLVRWYNPQPFLQYLPVENGIADLSTAAFNSMFLVLTPLAVMERYVKKIGRMNVAKLGFLWAMLMMVVPLIIIALQFLQ